MDDMLIGVSEATREVRRKVALAASCSLPVLIEGETGTGKELVARQIHASSPRAGHRLVTVDCSTLPENLLESELFGHAKGAFTGAVGSYGGRIQEAAGGTIFFDEIGNVPPSVQAKLLRFLDTGEFPRVRQPGLQCVDTRVVTATSQFLRDGVREGRVRKDFYYRLSAVYIWVPPLRERKQDIPALADHVLRQAGQERGAEIIEPAAMRELMDHDWPGNVRELKNALLVSLTSEGGDCIRSPAVVPTPEASAEAVGAEGCPEVRSRSLRGYLEQKEKEYLADLMLRRDGGLTELAEAADVSIRTLQRKFRYHNLRY